MTTIAIVMPTYNEASNIGRMIETLYEDIFPRIGGAVLHLVVADDESPDGTGRVVRSFLDKYETLHLSSGRKRGLGHAYVRGFTYAVTAIAADAIVEMDADFQHQPVYLKSMVDAFMDGADYVIGSRFMPGGSIPGEWAWYRKAISLLGNRFARTMLKLEEIHDLTSGFRLTRVKGVFDRIDLSTIMALNRFAYKVDLLYRTIQLSGRVVEVPIQFAPRHQEKSKFNPGELMATLMVVMRLRRQQR